MFRRKAHTGAAEPVEWQRHVQPRRRDLIKLAELWAWQAHATLETRDGQLGHVVSGEACDAQTLLLVEALLSGAQVRITVQGHATGRGRVPGMAERVWTGVVCGWSSAPQILARLGQFVWEGPGWGRLPELPVSEETLKVLALRRPDRPLGALLREADVDPSQVANELSALSRLAVVDVCSATDDHAPLHRVQPPVASADDTPSLGPFVAPVRDRETLVAALDGLRRKDPWLALGLLRDATHLEIAAVSQDLRDRHLPWPSDSPGNRKLLGLIRAEIDRVRAMLVTEDPTETDHFSEVLLH